MKITTEENFCRVFEIPNEKQYSGNHLFQGAEVVPMKMVDWFNPVIASSMNDFDPEKLKQDLKKFLNSKSYIKTGMNYLIIFYWGDSMTLSAGKKFDEIVRDQYTL